MGSGSHRIHIERFGKTFAGYNFVFRKCQRPLQVAVFARSLSFWCDDEKPLHARHKRMRTHRGAHHVKCLKRGSYVDTNAIGTRDSTETESFFPM